MDLFSCQPYWFFQKLHTSEHHLCILIGWFICVVIPEKGKFIATIVTCYHTISMLNRIQGYWPRWFWIWHQLKSVGTQILCLDWVPAIVWLYPALVIIVITFIYSVACESGSKLFLWLVVVMWFCELVIRETLPTTKPTWPQQTYGRQLGSSKEV